MSASAEPGPLVSVVLPTHNRATLVVRSLASVLAQSYSRLEVVVVDDASTDETAACVAGVKDSRVRLVQRRERGGAGAARNTGIEAATGELIAFQDSDDEWSLEKIARQVRALASAPRIGLVCCPYLSVGLNGRTERHPVDAWTRSGDARAGLLRGLYFVPSTWLVRRSALASAGLFDVSLPAIEDWDIAFRLSDVCDVAVVDEYLVTKHEQPTSVYRHMPNRACAYQVVVDRHAHRWTGQRTAYAMHRFEVAKLQAEFGDLSAARRNFCSCLVADPMNWRAAALLLGSLLGRTVVLAMLRLNRQLVERRKQAELAA